MREHVTRPRRSRPAVLAAAVALLVPLGVLPAAAQFTVTVRAEATYGTGPGWGYAFTPALAPGSYSEGNARCDTVIVNGAYRRINDVYLTLDVGNYELRDCYVSAGFPLRVVDTDGHRFPVTEAVGSTYRVTAAPTEMSVDVRPDDNGRMLFTVVVFDVSREATYVVGAEVSATYQTLQGFQSLACKAVTEYLDPVQPWLGASAQCDMSADDFLAGTGYWTVAWGGSANYDSTAASGWADGGQTTPAQAALNLASLQIEIVLVHEPAGCVGRVDALRNSPGLIGISLGVVAQNCTALKVLEIATDVVLSFLPGPGQAIGSVFVKIASAARHAKAVKFVKAATNGVPW